MITIELADNKYFALRSAFEDKDRVKALGDYPDVKWDAVTRRWLVHAALWVKVVSQLADLLNPIDPDVAMALPIYKPNLRMTARDKQYAKQREKYLLKQHAKMNEGLRKLTRG